MLEGKEGSSAAMNSTVVKRKSDRELVVTRTFNGPAQRRTVPALVGAEGDERVTALV
jgi:hypothetical protein